MEDDEDGEGAGMSLSALEEKLKPEIFTYFEEIEKLYEKLAKIQQKRLDNLTAGGGCEFALREESTRSCATSWSRRSSRCGCIITASRSWWRS